ncbi:Alpha/Beta hydrolase protein [Parachaetomium inaequale]|uniref:Alpha/Beta hydrolase protein n=1 Tax=Parachaetomium inaequale TaxID=2588326 RepID=A0AAN6SLD8_9PEZI|nr:Alpha/Beta hydrolase protein [Parachaetomium inaequale]
MAEAVSSPAADEVKPYKIHIPTKHLDLTRQKLELTRLPHEPSPSDSNTWAPKPIIEPLIDYWLENYSWRTTESRLNTIPQFRTAITPPGSGPDNHTPPIRIHFIHARSQQPNSSITPIPLLLIPPFPLPALSLAPLLPLLTTTTTTTENENGENEPQQTFHVVIPSLPGTAFSDPLPPTSGSSSSSSSSSRGTRNDDDNNNNNNNNNPVVATAALFDALMRRLGYETYLVSATTSTSTFGSGSERIDERIVRRLVRAHGASCVGGHLISPVLEKPRWRWDGGGLFGEWGRWVVASVLKKGARGGGVDGYERGDFEVLGRSRERDGKGGKDGKDKGVVVGGLAEANTLAYALCDSPVGMLAFVLRGLRAAAGIENGKGRFMQEALVTLASLMWLPGPEGMLRFWAACRKYCGEEKMTVKGVKPRVAITVFTGAGGGRKGKGPATDTALADDIETTGLWPTAEEVADRKESYCPPAWARPLFDVVHTQRVPGPSSGLLAFEQPEVILAGVRGLAKAVLAKGVRFAPAAPLKIEAVVPAGTSKQATETPGDAFERIAVNTPGAGEPSAEAAAVAPTVASETAPPGDATGKRKEEVERLAPPAKGPSAEDESPDTLVNTPLLERA